MSSFVYSDEELQKLRLDDSLTSEDVSDFFGYFAREREKNIRQENSKFAHLFDALAAIVLMAWYPDQKEVFGPPEQINQYRLFENGQLKDADANMLRGVLRNISNAALKARVGDILWHFKRDYKSAKAAISSYVAYAKQTDDPREWTEPVFALTRALAIAKSLGKNAPEIDEVLEYVEECVIRENGQDPFFFSQRLIRLLLDNDYGDITHLAQLAEKLARNEEQSSELACERAQQHWQLAADCYHKLGDDAAERQAIINSAEVWVKVAEVELQHPTLARFQISVKYERAIHILRTIAGTRERVDGLRSKLLEVQREARKQMIPSSISLENNPEALRLRALAVKSVTKENFIEAFLTFAELHFSPSFELLRQQALEAQEKYLLKKFFPTKIVDAFGRTVANPPQGQEETLLADIFQHQSLLRQGIVGLTIEPARQEILHSHTFGLADLALIIEGNPLAPYGHEYSIAKGILAGLQGDFFTSSHLLVPQIEATCRHILGIQGKLSSKYTKEGIQDEISLNQMLEEEEFLSTISEVLGKDTVYDLRGLLVDRFGANFRNNLAHGLLFDSQLHSSESIYLWYLAVHIYSRPLIAAIRERLNKTNDTM